MARNPVQNDSDPLLVATIDEMTKLVRIPKTARWRIITGDLVTPGTAITNLLKKYRRINRSSGKQYGQIRPAAKAAGITFVNTHLLSHFMPDYDLGIGFDG
jgi:hypothetical protein